MNRIVVALAWFGGIAAGVGCGGGTLGTPGAGGASSVLQGIGGALFEAVRFGEGRIDNARFSQYRVPRFSDVPDLDVVILDRKDLPSAGAGETPIVGVAPAIGNAIAAAGGPRLRTLPMLPEGRLPEPEISV